MEFIYIKGEPNDSGCYGAPRTDAFDGALVLPVELLETYLQSKGFVTLELDEYGGVVGMQENTAALAAWKAAVPEERNDPTEQEQLRADVDYLSIMTGVAL